MRDQVADLRVLVAGSPAPAVVRDGEFEIAGIEPGPIDLRFGADDEEAARMDIRGLPGGASLDLLGVRLDSRSDLAFPARVRLEGARIVLVNGLRMGDPEALPERVEADGVVLAINGDADALLVRPRDEEMPDLRVVVVPSTRSVAPGGEEVSTERLSRGDPVRVEGRAEAGFVFADRIVMAAGQERGGDRREAASGDPVRGSRGGSASGEPRDPGEGGRGVRGKSEGSGDIPAGHRPPPGECRDWIPGLPPGQQPPPRKC